MVKYNLALKRLNKNPLQDPPQPLHRCENTYMDKLGDEPPYHQLGSQGGSVEVELFSIQHFS